MGDIGWWYRCAILWCNIDLTFELAMVGELGLKYGSKNSGQAKVKGYISRSHHNTTHHMPPTNVHTKDNFLHFRVSERAARTRFKGQGHYSMAVFALELNFASLYIQNQLTKATLDCRYPAKHLRGICYSTPIIQHFM